MILPSLSPLIPTGNELSAILVVVSFSAGLNVYATVGMLGLLARLNVLALPPALHALQDWKIIALCGALFLLEFVGEIFRCSICSGTQPTRSCAFQSRPIWPTPRRRNYRSGNRSPQPSRVVYRACSAWWEDSRARSHPTFAGTVLESRAKHSRRRVGGISDVDCYAAPVLSVRDRPAGARRDRDTDSLRSARAAYSA